MKTLLEYVRKIINNNDVPSSSVFGFILKKLESLEDIVHLLDIDNSKMRFQDYIDFSKDYSENLEYFVNFTEDANSIIAYNIYYIKKELTDLLEMIINGDFTIEEVDNLYSAEYMYNLLNIISSIKDSVRLDYDEEPIYMLPPEATSNIIIFSDHLDDIRNMSLESKGNGISSLKKSMKAIDALMSVSYTNKDMAGRIHKIKEERGKDLRLTDRSILGERYSTGRQTKVAFLKIPIHPSNMQKLKDKLNYPNVECIYFIFGFCSFKDIGLSEPDLYSSVGVPNLVQKIATAASQSFTNCSFNNSCGLPPDCGYELLLQWRVCINTSKLFENC